MLLCTSSHPMSTFRRGSAGKYNNDWIPTSRKKNLHKLQLEQRMRLGRWCYRRLDLDLHRRGMLVVTLANGGGATIDDLEKSAGDIHPNP